MSPHLPDELQTARDSATWDGGASLLQAFEHLEEQQRGLGWLGLWVVASEEEAPQFGRTLSFALARQDSGEPIVDAIRLWFFHGWVGDDLSTLVNILTSLERVFDETTGELPRTSRSSVLPFLTRCLDHAEAIVRHSVLDFAEIALLANAFDQFVSRDSAHQFSLALHRSLAQTVTDGEIEFLAKIQEGLAAESLPTRAPAAPAELRELASYLQSTRLLFHEHVGDIAGLIQVVDERATHDGIAAGETSSDGIIVPDFAALAAEAAPTDQYTTQLRRVRSEGNQTDCIDMAVAEIMAKLPSRALVVYGDPQSGKTEMMICLTARLLDAGEKLIVHLMNDSVDLLTQSLDRFKLAALAPAPRSASDLATSPLVHGQSAVLFCKKNTKDLQKLIAALHDLGSVVVIDDEADYATPNSRINNNEKTKINELIEQLLADTGRYVGVTATPARLNLNNTFNNRAETWVRFRPHAAYTGQDAFFPLTGATQYRLVLLPGTPTSVDAHRAFARFLVTVACLNTRPGATDENYSFLVHTSGKTADHVADRKIIEAAMTALRSGSGPPFEAFARTIFDQAVVLYGAAAAEDLTRYVIRNASRSSFVVLNSKRDRITAGDKPTHPTCPFTVIIGGNIVSRGVTFPNLLSMYFTRDVAAKLQQDTYIQRARMFGAREKYLEHFELTIPKRLYADWHRCFVFHRLSLEAIENNRLSPVWVGDPRISIASSSSIDRGTVDLNRGEMSFQIFDLPDPAALDAVVTVDQKSTQTLRRMAQLAAGGLPTFLIEYLERSLAIRPDTLAIHKSASIEDYGTSADQDAISRAKGFIGRSQLEIGRFPNAVHHVKVLYNGRAKARVFYKNVAGVQFVQNMA